MALDMNKRIPSPVTAFLALAFAGASQAAPTEPAAPAPTGGPLRYESAFSDYKPWQDVAPGNWRALNDALVTAPAGHGVHGAAPAAAGQATAPAKPAPAQPAPAAGHGAHHMHGGHQ